MRRITKEIRRAANQVCDLQEQRPRLPMPKRLEAIDKILALTAFIKRLQEKDY